MSNYTDSMVAALHAQDTWTYDECAAFAADHSDLTTRSVISKVKSEGLTYIPKAKPTPSATVQIRKSDVVATIAAAIGVNVEAIEGLAKADKRSLEALAKAVA